eukprot:976490-Alexandrium_andersonii.AAC.1
MEGLEGGTAGSLGSVGVGPPGPEGLQQGPRVQGQLPEGRAREDDGVPPRPRGGLALHRRNGLPGRSGSQREGHRFSHPANQDLQLERRGRARKAGVVHPLARDQRDGAREGCHPAQEG